MIKDNHFDHIYAKSDGITTLEMHTRHVIEAGNQLLQKLPFEEEEKEYWREKLYRCAVLHDLGKIHPAFQNNLKGEERVTIRHEIISLWFCENFLDLSQDEKFAIATHHKGINKPNGDSKNLDMNAFTAHMEDHYENSNKTLEVSTLIDWLRLFGLEYLVLNSKGEPKPKISKETQMIFRKKSQLVVIPILDERINLSLMRALLIAADHIGSARLEHAIPSYKQIQISDFQPKKDNEIVEFRSFQTRMLNIQGDMILHAPTGSGKTEAALCWVHANQQANSRLFYLLPYTASINAMTKRLETVFGHERVTALHSKTLDFFYGQLSEEASNQGKVDYSAVEKEARSRKSISNELFYPVKVATLHQVLKTSLKGKGWELALYDYKNALFIIDEFHTYNALLTGMLLSSIQLFRKIFQSKFLFMSATIPKFMLHHIMEKVFDGDRSKIVRPDILELSDREILNRKRHTLFAMTGKSIKDEIGTIQNYLKDGRSVLVVVNNVKTAQNLFEQIEFFEKDKVALLHSGFNKKGRTDIENRITHPDKNIRPKLLIATQAVEVSLDIDYDVAYIENAPIDALIQRFGRVNRAGKKGVSPVYLFENIIGNTKFFYDESVLKNTWIELTIYNGHDLSENDLINVCDKVYELGYSESQQKDFEKGLNNSIINLYEEEWVAGDWEDWIENVIEKTDGQKVEIICGNLIEEFESLRLQKRYIEANQLLVQVYFYELKNTAFSKDESGSFIVAYDFYYDSTIGYTKAKSDDLFL
jgi:CRISPR-associated endonuclease/helicase Cas3